MTIEETAVVVTTEYRGVFFGYTSDAPGVDTMTLKRARNCIYWSAKTGGFMGLAAIGPQAGSRIGERVSEITLRKVTSVAPASAEAVKVWEDAIVYRG